MQSMFWGLEGEKLGIISEVELLCIHQVAPLIGLTVYDDCGFLQ